MRTSGQAPERDTQQQRKEHGRLQRATEVDGGRTLHDIPSGERRTHRALYGGLQESIGFGLEKESLRNESVHFLRKSGHIVGMTQESGGIQALASDGVKGGDVLQVATLPKYVHRKSET